jgi:hypothetical protein
MLMLKDEEVLYLLEVQLPDMLEREPELEPRAFRAFLKVFTTKEETAAILAELQEHRAEFRHFRSEMEDFRSSVEERFEQVDQRFDQVDQRFDQVDQRFDQVDQRFDQVDQRFEQVDQRFDQVDQRFDQVDQRFEQVDGRFEQVDQRFEQVDGRFEQVDQRFEQVDGRFEQVDGHFEQVDQRFNGVNQQLVEIRQTIADLRDWVETNVGGLQRRSGRKLEDVVAGALRVALRRSDIKPDQLRLRQKIVDEKGVIGLPGQRRFEIDIIARDGQISVFEVKSFCEWEDVDRLADKVALIQALNPGVKVEGIMIAMSINDGVRERCAELGITLAYHGD